MQRCLMLLTVLWLACAGNGAAQTAPPTGDHHGRYLFAPTGTEMPYRVYVPSSWNGQRSLPIVLFLHGAGANESTYLESADGLLGKLAEQHGYIVVSPLGFSPARRVRQSAAIARRVRRIGDGGRPARGRHAGAPPRARLERTRGHHRARARDRTNTARIGRARFSRGIPWAAVALGTSQRAIRSAGAPSRRCPGRS